MAVDASCLEDGPLAQSRGLVLSGHAFSRSDSCLVAVPIANLPCLVPCGHFGFIVALPIVRCGFDALQNIWPRPSNMILES